MTMVKKFFKGVAIPLLRIDGLKGNRHEYIALHPFSEEYENSRWKAIFMAADCIAFCGIDTYYNNSYKGKEGLKGVKKFMHELHEIYKEDYPGRKIKVRGRGIVYLDVYTEEDNFTIVDKDGLVSHPHFKWANYDARKDEKFSKRHMRTKTIERAFKLAHSLRPLTEWDIIDIKYYNRKVDRT